MHSPFCPYLRTLEGVSLSSLYCSDKCCCEALQEPDKTRSPTTRKRNTFLNQQTTLILGSNYKVRDLSILYGKYSNIDRAQQLPFLVDDGLPSLQRIRWTKAVLRMAMENMGDLLRKSFDVPGWRCRSSRGIRPSRGQISLSFISQWFVTFILSSTRLSITYLYPYR